MRALITAAVAAVLIVPAPLMAQQDAPKAEKHENVTFYEIVNVDFKPGMADEALDLIRKHFAPAVREAGTPGPVMQLEHRTGEWDVTFIWHMKRGPSEMEWKRSPESIKWEKKFVEMVGGEEKAREIGEKYESYIQRSNVTIAMQDDELMLSLNE